MIINWKFLYYWTLFFMVYEVVMDMSTSSMICGMLHFVALIIQTIYFIKTRKEIKKENGMIHEDEVMCNKNTCLFTDHGYCTADIDGITPNSDRCSKFTICSLSARQIKINREIEEYF